MLDYFDIRNSAGNILQHNIKVEAGGGREKEVYFTFALLCVSISNVSYGLSSPDVSVILEFTLRKRLEIFLPNSGKIEEKNQREVERESEMKEGEKSLSGLDSG